MNQHNFAAMRSAMIVSQLRTIGVNSPTLLAAFETVARENYVPETRAALAYVDIDIPFDSGRSLNTPLASARLLSEAQVYPSDTVLLIGAATGYLAAVLAQLASHVVAVDDDVALLSIAERELGSTTNVALINAPLTAGAPAHAPYDLIVIDGAVEELPEALVAQLKVGGRLATGIIERGVTRLAVGRKSHGGFGLVPFIESACVCFPEFSKPKVFSFS